MGQLNWWRPWGCLDERKERGRVLYVSTDGIHRVEGGGLRPAESVERYIVSNKYRKKWLLYCLHTHTRQSRSSNNSVKPPCLW